MEDGSTWQWMLSAAVGYVASGYETILLILFMVGAFCSSLISGILNTYSRSELDNLIDSKNGDRESLRHRLDRDLEDIDKLQYAASAMTTIALFLAAIMFYRELSRRLSPDTLRSAWFWLVIIPILLLVVFVIQFIPKIMAYTWGERILLRWSRLMRVMLSPLFFIGSAAKRFDVIRSRLAGEEIKPEGEELQEDLIDVIREGEQEGWIESDEAMMVKAVFKLKDKDAALVMTPRTEIEVIEDNVSVMEALKFAHENGHSRIPVFHETRDNITGIFYVKDALGYIIENSRLDELSVAEITRKPYFIPDTKRLDGLLEDMQHNKIHSAIVLDEYGGTDGLVTLEDILEEVVGEVADEYDEEPEPEFKLVSEGIIEADGRAHLEDLNETLGVNIPDSDEFDTIAGYVVAEMEHIPEAGEIMETGELTIRVLEADARRVLKVRLEKKPSDEAVPAAEETAEKS